MGSQCASHPYQEAGFDGLNIGPDLLYSHFEVGLDRGDVRLGGQVGFEQVNLLVRQGLGLRLGEAVGRKVLHKPVGVECDRCGHDAILDRPRGTGNTANPGDSSTNAALWYNFCASAKWNSPYELKADLRSANILKNHRVVFNVCGNKYRIVVLIDYERHGMLIRFVGTHEQYDAIDDIEHI